MKRILLVLTVALMMAVMMVAMAAPAFAGNIRDQPQGEDNLPPYVNPPFKEPPLSSGNFPTTVFHCNTDLRGDLKGAEVHNKNNVGGQGDC